MMLFTIIVAGLITYGVGRAVVRVLGWPRDLESAMRWSIALVCVAAVYAGLPELMTIAKGALPPIPSELLSVQIPLPNVLAGLGMVGLGVLGYVAWRGASGDREAREREMNQSRHDLRRRALPPAPHEQGNQRGFTPLGTNPPPDENP